MVSVTVGAGVGTPFRAMSVGQYPNARASTGRRPGLSPPLMQTLINRLSTTFRTLLAESAT